MHLIVGGTGTLGSAVVRRLSAAGAPVRVMTRTPESAIGLATHGVEVVQGDLLDKDTLNSACKGADVLVAAAHSILGRGRAASVHVDGRGHRDLIDAAKTAGVRQVVYTSVYDHGAAYHAIPFFRIKSEVEAHLKASGLSYTILRPTAFMETHVHKLIGESILRKGKTALFGRGDNPRNFVAADDVARLAVLASGDRSLTGQTINIGGPEDFTGMEVVRIYEQVCGRTANVTHVPLGMLRIAYRLMRRVHPGLSQVMQAGILDDTVAQHFDAGPLEERFGFELTRLEDWLAEKVSVLSDDWASMHPAA